MALRFTNGNTEFVDFGSVAAFNDLTTMSVLVLAKVTTIVAGVILVAKKVDGGATAGWRFNTNGTGGVVFNRRYASDATNYISTTDMVVDDTWRWYACTFDAAAGAGTKVKFYACDFGGSLVETGSYTATTDAATALLNDTAEELRIGNFNTTSPTATPSADIEYAVLYDAALSLANLQSAVDGVEDSLSNGHTTDRVGEWRVGWAAGTAVVDQSGSGNDGTTTGATNTAGILEGGGATPMAVFVHHYRQQGMM